jgi:CelD/BcsL family acetyltransferase involved in cellulose biosynthesis
MGPTTPPLPGSPAHPVPGAADAEVTSEIVSGVDRLERIRQSWDALAETTARPYCAPGWALPWWEHVRPAGGELMSVALTAGADLVGFAPFHVTRDRWGNHTWTVLGGDSGSYAEPLSTARHRRDLAEAITAAMTAGDRPADIVSLRGIPHDSPWPRLLRDAWPGARPRTAQVAAMPAPFVDLPSGGYDEWFAGRSSNFRQQVRRRQREFLRRGGTFRMAGSAAEVAAGLEEFERLHTHRWAARGGSRALTAPVSLMLRQVGAVLGPSRLQVWTAELDGRSVGSAVFLAAGDEVHYWLGGFDDTSSELSPSLLLLVEAVRQAAEAGCRRLSLGPGAQPYKSRLATGEDQLVWVDLLPVSPRLPRVLLCQAPYRLHRVAATRISPRGKQRLRSVAARFGVPSVAPHRSGTTTTADGTGTP